MSSAQSRIEHLRGQALRFANRLHRNPAVAADQQLLRYANNNDCRDFLEEVELRFLNRQDGAGETHSILMALNRSYFNRRRLRSRLYGDVFILLIGHADLFTRFERLRFMDDGREETRRQIRGWRNSVRNVIMTAIFRALGECWSAIVRLRRIIAGIPQTLNGRNLNLIGRACFPAGVDPDNLRVTLTTNPATVRQLVLPTLVDMRAHFSRLDCFLTRYFNQVASWGL